MNRESAVPPLIVRLPKGALALLYEIVADGRLGNTDDEVAKFFLTRALDDYARAHSATRTTK